LNYEQLWEIPSCFEKVETQFKWLESIFVKSLKIKDFEDFKPHFKRIKQMMH